MTDIIRKNSADQLIPSSPGRPSGTPPANSGSGTPPPPRQPLKPIMADGPENKSDKKLRRGLLIAGVSVGFLFILILTIAVLTSGSGANSILAQIVGPDVDINSLLLRIINFVFGIAGIIALISVVIGGFIYVVSMGNPREMKRARGILITSTIALLFLLFVYILLYSLLQNKISAPDPNATPIVPEIATNPDPARGPSPLEVTFDINNFVDANYFYSWDFGDGSTGTGRPVSHTFQEQNQYIVRVVITSGTETLQELTTNVSVTNTRPKAVIDADPVSGTAPLSVAFDASRSEDPKGELREFKWDFGDKNASADNPNTAVGEKAVHEFSEDGVYNVTLTIVDNNGDEGTTTQQITVGAEPDAPNAIITTTPAAKGFAPLTVNGIIPFKVNFSGSKSTDADGEIVSYAWDYGDGSPEEKGQAVNHTFTEPGIYETLLTVTDNTDKKGVAKVRVIVATPDAIPTAVITSIPQATRDNTIRKTAPFTIKLDGTKSTDSDGELVQFEWNLGDNSTGISGPTAEYTYTEPGDYTITLTVTDSSGNTNVTPAELLVTVLAAGPQAPVAVIKTDPEDPSGVVPFRVMFDGSDSSDADGTILSYEWDFGDGRTLLSGAQVSHVYDSPGIYTVTLTVHDNAGMNGETAIPVAAHIAAPVARIETNKTLGNSPLTVQFDASSSSGSIKRYDWNFDDGTSARGRTAEHTFTASGDYDVELLVTDAVEQVDTETIRIRVN